MRRERAMGGEEERTYLLWCLYTLMINDSIEVSEILTEREVEGGRDRVKSQNNEHRKYILQTAEKHEHTNKLTCEHLG
jgi:hypothetical protein